MRQKIILFSLFPSVFYFSQGIDNKAYIKANALLLPAGVMNVGAEYRLSKKYTLQGDILVSPWKSFAGKMPKYIWQDLVGDIISPKHFASGIWERISQWHILICKNGIIGKEVLPFRRKIQS